MRCKTYAELEAFANRPTSKYSPQENIHIVERMRQLRYGYKPGELKLDKTVIKQYSSMEEFREATEREYQEEIAKYGPR